MYKINKTYYSVTISGSFDGNTLEISNIMKNNNSTSQSSWNFVSSSLYETLKMTLKDLKRCIKDLTNPDIAPPMNKDIWLIKAKKAITQFYLTYSDEYPELFI